MVIAMHVGLSNKISDNCIELNHWVCKLYAAYKVLSESLKSHVSYVSFYCIIRCRSFLLEQPLRLDLEHLSESTGPNFPAVVSHDEIFLNLFFLVDQVNEKEVSTAIHSAATGCLTGLRMKIKQKEKKITKERMIISKSVAWSLNQKNSMKKVIALN